MPAPIIWRLRGKRPFVGPAGLASGTLAAGQQKPVDPDPPKLSPILFAFAEAHARSGKFLGAGPSFQGRLPLPAERIVLSGTTKDSTGAALGNCTVLVFRTSDKAYIGSTVSDANGAYAFALPTGGAAEQYFAISYLAGSPDVAGTTVNTLTGTAT